ncbi:MAG TPA: alpha/beta hydrolase [Spirochaetota bacterium]|nr:alpha/beta hydrolase [Spirochaetota bacterium]HOD15747.1 alpha/beta hydrolase [Spirochaetota bacterium]HPN14017.1 alpha/beta hydrolase [Spirochaetota bacterium]
MSLLKKSLLAVLTLSLVFPAALFAGGSSSKCATKYPIVLAHGMGTQAKIMQLIDYWGNIPSSMEDEGADVYITSVNAMDATANKALAWKKQVLQILAVTGAKKVNVIGHSHGCLYTRYAITNLGLSSMVASHTSIAGPHRGSVIADMIMGIIPDSLEPMVGDVLDTVMSFIMGDNDGNSVANGYDLTRSYMINTFNPNTPNISSIYYQSYAYKVKNVICAGPIFSITWLAMLPYEGDNDVLVSVTSAKWGNFKGVISGASWGYGVNHLGAVGMLSGLMYPPSIGYDPATHFENIAADLKSRGY